MAIAIYPSFYVFKLESGTNNEGDVWLYSKGHHNPADFLAWAMQEYGVPSNALVKQEYWRWGIVTIDGDRIRQCFPTKPGKGAFPVTYVHSYFGKWDVAL